MKHLRITHKDTGTLLAEGPVGWGITPFEGNFYIARKYLRSQPVDATQALNLSAGVSNSIVSRGRSEVQALKVETL